MLRMKTVTMEAEATAVITLSRPLLAARELCQLWRFSCQLSRGSFICSFSSSLFNNSILTSSYFVVVSFCSNLTSDCLFSMFILSLFCPCCLIRVLPCCISTSFCFTLMPSCLRPVSFWSMATSSWCNLTIFCLIQFSPVQSWFYLFRSYLSYPGQFRFLLVSMWFLLPFFSVFFFFLLLLPIQLTSSLDVGLSLGFITEKSRSYVPINSMCHEWK